MYLVTGSTGHLGEALMRMARANGWAARGIDIKPGAFTDQVGDIADVGFVTSAMAGVTHVLHTATLHKPHVATHARQDFVTTNITGTLTLLQAAAAHRVAGFVFTSTTSAFGRALVPGPDDPAAWVTEDLRGLPKNIYGATKIAAEELCALSAYRDALPVVVLRTSRFFPEADDSPQMRASFEDGNAKLNELLYRRVDIEDAASAHFLAAERAPSLGFARYIISAPTPFDPADAQTLRHTPAALVEAYLPGTQAIYAAHGWKLPQDISRVYDSSKAQTELGWHPRHSFAAATKALADGTSFGSDLGRAVGVKGYHSEEFTDGPYPVEADAPRPG